MIRKDAMRLVAAALWVGSVLITAACSHSTPPPTEHIKVTNQLIVSQHAVSGYFVTGVPSGGYVVGGSSKLTDTYGWATRVDLNGQQRWEHLDGPRGGWDDTQRNVSRFNGAVSLPDDQTLLCGTRTVSGPKSAGRLVAIQANGAVSVERDLYPKGDADYSAQIHRCLRWADGLALIGEAQPRRSDGVLGWLVKLDLTGAVLWEKWLPAVGAMDALETPGHELLIASPDFLGHHQDDSRIDKLDVAGNVVASLLVKGHAQFVRPPSSDWTQFTVITQATEGPTSLLRVDSNLKVTQEPVAIGTFPSNRCFELSDHSIVMFGSIRERGATAAVGRVYDASSLRIFPLESLHASPWINDAVRVDSAAGFVTVRPQGPAYQATLALISIEQ